MIIVGPARATSHPRHPIRHADSRKMQWRYLITWASHAPMHMDFLWVDAYANGWALSMVSALERWCADTNALWLNPPTDPQEALAALGGLFFSPSWVAAHLEVVKEMFQVPPIPEYTRKLHYQASEGHDCWDLLPTISTPVLVIHGGEDLMNPTANAYLLAERIPGAQLYFVESGRHAYLVEFREEASRVVKEFLAHWPL
jgi:pimeloyl-ACP methyl ester carboxylesterase